MRVYAYGERGIGKRICEDSMMVGNGIISEGFLTWETLDNNIVLAVADGVGGNNAGEEASLVALEGLREAELFLGADEGKIKSSIQQINKEIVALSQSNPKFDKMATTLTGIVFVPEHVFIFHIGNTRCYTVNNGQFLNQLTVDMTKVQDDVNAGLMTQKEAAQSDESHIINACLGAGNTSMADRLEVFDAVEKINSSSPILLMSDGIHDYLPIDDMEDILTGDLDVEAKLKSVAKKARENGSQDDISIIYVDRMN
jgi:protein phosphatase